jgi:uncharacterized protein YndB with AHSA1/START domain
MTVIRNSTLIRCSPEEAFDYLSDLRNERDWNPTVESVEMLTDGPVGVGSRFRAKWKGGPAVVVETVRYDRPSTWEHHNGGPVRVVFRGTVEPVAEGSRLSVDFDARPQGWFRLLFPLFLLKLRRDEKANMTYLRRALELRAESGGPGTAPR